MLYLDWFLIFLIAKVLAPGSYTLMLPPSLRDGNGACEPPGQGRAKSVSLPCPHSACVLGNSGMRAWQGEDGGASWTP